MRKTPVIEADPPGRPYSEFHLAVVDLAGRYPTASSELRQLAAAVLTHPKACPDAVLLLAEGIKAVAESIRIDDEDDRQVRHTAMLAAFVAKQVGAFAYRPN